MSTTSTDLTPPKSAGGTLRGALALLGSAILIAAVTLATVDPAMYSIPLIILSSLIVAVYVVAAFVSISRWRRQHNAWAARAATWLVAQGITAGDASDLTRPTPTRLRLPQFPDAQYVARIEGALQDTYLVIVAGQAALYEAHGDTISPRQPQTPQSAPIL